MVLVIYFVEFIGQAYQEGGNHREVRYQIWCLPQKNGQKNGNYPAQQIHLHILRKGNVFVYINLISNSVTMIRFKCAFFMFILQDLTLKVDVKNSIISLHLNPYY